MSTQTKDNNDYKCNLTEYSLTKAKAELHEDPKDRLAAVKALKDWILSQPHLSSRTDTRYLLDVLRTAKFSQLRGREIVDNYLTMKTKHPELMANLDTQDPLTLMWLEQKVLIPLPKRDPEGRQISLIRIGAYDANDTKFNDVTELRSSLTLNEVITMNDENFVVNGQLLVFDMTGTTMKHMMHMTSENAAKSMKVWQDCIPGRLKGMLFYNSGKIFELTMSIARPFMKKKYIDRIQVHDTMESMYKVIPMECWPEEYLPDDYTGESAGTMQSLVDKQLKLYADPEIRKRVLANTSNHFRMDEAKRPKDVAQQSYRKLNVD